MTFLWQDLWPAASLMFFSKLHSLSVLFYLQHPSRGWCSLHRDTLSQQMGIGPMELTLGYSVRDCFPPGNERPQLWCCMLSFMPAIWLFCSTGNTGLYWKKSLLYKGSSSLEFLSMPLVWSSSDKWHFTKKKKDNFLEVIIWNWERMIRVERGGILWKGSGNFC